MESMPKERGLERNVKTYASLPVVADFQSSEDCEALRLCVFWSLTRFANDNDNKMLMAQIIVKQERKAELEPETETELELELEKKAAAEDRQ